MTKKSFKTGFGSLLGEDNDTQENKQKIISNKKTKAATFVVRCDQFEKIKAISYMETKMLKEILEEALEAYILNYENKNGSVVLPKKQ
ncbi:MAG TPA: hypothetical protein QKA08_05430 [Candidatus Megaira endosymbiont of Nemacystus decipiens]|nr:hypothetical protein [Candidatus Megaera endosymbiont of Nemacystus decipiens]